MKNDNAARILELRRQGLKMSAIAKQVGVDQNLVWRELREAGLTVTPEELEARKQAALDRHAAVRDLHNQGLSRRQIAERHMSAA